MRPGICGTRLGVALLPEDFWFRPDTEGVRIAGRESRQEVR